jgi:inorganic pyrophosphatase
MKTGPPTSLYLAHPWHGVPARGETEGVFNVFVEIVPTDAVKYELDKKSGHLKIDRPQRFSNFCPTPYGFIPRTYCGRRVAERCREKTGEREVDGDGDPMDVCVLTEKPISHGNLLLQAIPIGGLRMIDGREADDKIVGVLVDDLAYGRMREIADVPREIIDRLRHYFVTYKQRPDDSNPKRVRIPEVYGRAEALEVLARSEEDYRELVSGNR